MEPTDKRAVAFFDGQNLFHAVKAAFGYSYPNFDPGRLAEAACLSKGWHLVQSRFYTGVPAASASPVWHRFWTGKLNAMRKAGIVVQSRPLRYRWQEPEVPGGAGTLVGQEKGVDVRIAIDVIRMAHHREYDVAVIFSQDQDLSEAAKEIREIAREQSRWIKVASAFPAGEAARSPRGIDRTDWVPFHRIAYDACLDLTAYR